MAFTKALKYQIVSDFIVLFFFNVGAIGEKVRMCMFLTGESGQW